MEQERKMALAMTEEGLMQVLYQQALELFGRERAEQLRLQIKERAGYLWLLSQHLPRQDEEIAFGFFDDVQSQEGMCSATSN